MEYFRVLDVKVSCVNPPKAFEVIAGFIEKKQKAYVCVAPVSTIVDAQKDADYKNIINKADMVTPDGMPLVWLAKLKGLKEVQRTYGPELMPMVCDKGRIKGFRHFFYGGTDQYNQKLTARLKERFPGIIVAGTYAPGFLKTGEMEKQEVISLINQAQPDILWIGLGSPKQDYWMASHRALLGAPVMIGVGAAFDFFTGTKKQAPKWMRACGLEWFFRLCSEPKRLWKRYLIGNTMFLYLLFRNFLASLFQKR